jgi:hypothetical protein
VTHVTEKTPNGARILGWELPKSPNPLGGNHG